jgi:hypothetical protein
MAYPRETNPAKKVSVPRIHYRLARERVNVVGLGVDCEVGCGLKDGGPAHRWAHAAAGMNRVRARSFRG